MSQLLDEKTPSLVNMPQDEKMLIESLLEYYDVDHVADTKVRERAKQYVMAIKKSKESIVESFIKEYGLSTEEGVAMMCIAESLLRIPDE